MVPKKFDEYQPYIKSKNAEKDKAAIKKELEPLKENIKDLDKMIDDALNNAPKENIRYVCGEDYVINLDAFKKNSDLIVTNLNTIKKPNP